MDLCSARTSAYLSLSRVGHAHRFQKMKAMRENMGNSLSPTGCNPSRIKNMVEIQAGKDRSTNPTFPLSREGTRASDSSETLLQLPSMQPGLAQSLCTTLVLLHGSQNQEKREPCRQRARQFWEEHQRNRRLSGTSFLVGGHTLPVCAQAGPSLRTVQGALRGRLPEDLPRKGGLEREVE